MGKLYEKELDNLNQTYQWALRIPLEKLYSFVNASYGLPLVAVGSGGSLTAAHMAALLNQKTGVISKGITPLELISYESTLRNTSVLILSAGGRNSDIQSAFRFAATSEPHQLMALCMRTGSPLAIISKKFRYTSFLDFDLPSGKDGFLATNSLLAFITILIRIYKDLFSEKYIIPENLPPAKEIYKQLYTSTQPLLEKDTWVVLYSGWGFPAAVDIESKFTEAALGHVQIADYRNFAHGRHHWLSKRGDKTAVVALITPEDVDIAKRTLDILPRNISTLQLITEKNGPIGSLDLIIKILHLVYLAAKAQGINPGMPRVPTFGRQIYNLRLLLRDRYAILPYEIDQKEAIAILRKSKFSSLSEMKREELEYWRTAYCKYIEKLENTLFGAIVFDYDGTLCDPDERYNGPPKEIGQELVHLLRKGIVIGIATGRGKSVRIDLQSLIPKKYWEKILIGYYNGSDIASLYDLNHPDKSSPLHISLQLIKNVLENHQLLNQVAKLEYRPKQITVEPINTTMWKKTRAFLFDIINKANAPNVRVLESSHSIDIVVSEISKLHLVKACEEAVKQVGNPDNVLCIGDNGEWPGNDYDLLSTPYSLSVHTVSLDPKNCWNLSPAGYRGVQATLEYLKCMKIEDDGLKLILTKRGGKL